MRDGKPGPHGGAVAIHPEDRPLGHVPDERFFEGGINLTREVPNIGCVSSFMAETRSSTPFDSRLKDLKLGGLSSNLPASRSTLTPHRWRKVTPGTSVNDKAIVTGTSLTGGTAPTPTGTIDFYLCQPSAVTANGCEAGDHIGVQKTGPALGTALCLASGCVSDSTTNTTAIGKYCWRAHYTPAAGSPYTEKDFNDTGDECFTTVAQPTTTATRQFVYPQDAAKVAASSGGDLAGSLAFRLYDNSTCTDADDVVGTTGLVYKETDVAVAGAAPQTRKTSNTSFKIVDGTTYYWKVNYTSTNTGQLNSVSDCLESTMVTFANNDTTITIPS